MKQKLLLFITALMLCIGARAQNAIELVINGLRYRIDEDKNCAMLIKNSYTLSKIIIPANITCWGKKYPVTKLEDRCFYNCTSLTSITIPSSVIYLGYSCFEGCSELTSVTIGSGNGQFSIKADPSSVTNLRNRCFYGCTSLTSVTITSSVTSLGDECFSNCTSLTSVTIPSSVTSLGWRCFSDCNNLYSVNIQSPEITLGSFCFASTIIADFTIMATTPPTILNGCFNGCSIDRAKLRVPKASVSSYKNAEVWKSFGTIVSVDGEEVARECEKPSINYVSGKLKFGCQTPGAEYHYTIKAADGCTESLTKDEVSLAARYDISCFATAKGYTRSKTATAKLYWISANIETDGIAPATQMRGVVVSTEGGIVTLSGLKENERVTFYNVSGIKLGEIRAMNGQASISASDDIIIARIGSQSIKVKR